MRSSVVIPAAAGMLVFGEPACAIRLAGCAAVLASFAMAGANPGTKGPPAARGAGWLSWMAICWGANGLAQVIQVWVAKEFPGGEVCYLVAFYGSGAAAAAALAGFRRQWPCRADGTYGALAAAGSLLGMVALMRALALLDASVVMPVSIAGAMALIMVAGRYVFGERLAVRDWAVVVLASAGSALLAAS
jgi:multidrug transporter EmrE-like cation transporter